MNIQSMASGIQEFATQALSSVQGGSELLVATGDDCGFTFTSASSIGASPKETWMTPFWATSTDVGKIVLLRALSDTRPHTDHGAQTMPETSQQMLFASATLLEPK